MSNEWKMVRLGDICEYIRNGANIKQSDNAGGTPITRIETLSNDKFNRDRLGYADIADDKYSKYYLNNHDILMSHINSEKYLGRAVLYTKESEDETIIHGMNLLSLRTLNDKVIAPFLAYYFATVSFKSQIAKISKKSVNQASFSVSCLNKVNIPLPSIKRQREIAAVLDKASELVEKRKAQLAELDRLAESIFYDMFGNPVTNEKGWKISQLSKLGSLKNGLNFAKNESGNITKILGIPDFKNNKCISSNYITADVFTNDIIHSDYLLCNEDLVFVRSNGSKDLVGRCVIVYIEDEAVTFSGFCIRFRNESDIITSTYLISILSNSDFRLNWTSEGRGCNINNINQQMLKNLVIPIPPLALQQQFAERIEKIEEQKAKAKEALKESENLFQRLMQDMFNPDYHNS